MAKLRWRDYLGMLERSPSSLGTVLRTLTPRVPLSKPTDVRVLHTKYRLWSFQERILNRISGSTLILGLPTGLGKTYIAGAYLMRESRVKPIRVLFLVPSIPLGVQQTLFARNMLGVKHAYFISGAVPPEKRARLGVWNWGFVVCTPQTVYNDFLKKFDSVLEEAKRSEDPVGFLKNHLDEAPIPFDIIIADECQNYIGETDGYGILLTARACGVKILALSATPQLHSARRLEELRRVFDRIEVISIDESAVKAMVPRRTLRILRIPTPPTLLKLYRVLNKLVDSYRRKVVEAYGEEHLRENCRRHGLCLNMRMLETLRTRMVEDGASSVLGYRAWRLKELQRPLEELGGRSVVDLYRRTLFECRNHKHEAVLSLLDKVRFKKAIVFMESIRSARQLGLRLLERMGFDKVSILVGKGGMSLEQQASALLRFRSEANVLVATSVAEEGLDIPSADFEVWLDPPSNPKKWIQRFGRILRQPEGKKEALVYALVSDGTHEEAKLRRVLRLSERVYGFTQNLSVERFKRILGPQKTLKRFIG